MRGILGRKVGMTQLFNEDGEVIPVTVIQAGPCYVTQVKRQETDGYSAVQLGFDQVRERRLTQGQLGHVKKAGLPAVRHLHEVRAKNDADINLDLGQEIKVDVFAVGERVDVTGTSKGRGFQGGVKRHGFRGGPKTHGQSDRLRAPGAINAGSTPGRVFKGTRMAGHMGNETVTMQNLQVVTVDPERNLIAVRGAVPGPKNGLVLVREARKQRRT